MKKLLFTSLLMLSTLWGISQITITNANTAPEGVTIIQANDTLPDSSLVPGDAGPNQTWNFSSVSANEFDTLYTMLPSWTPYSDSFPGANYVIRQIMLDDTNYIFMDKNDDFFASLGYMASTNELEIMAIHVIPQEVIMDFPVEYGNQRNESFYYEQTISSEIPGYDSLRYKTSTEKSVTVDAWGSITIPTGTYNCLRTKTDETDYDSTWVLANGTWILAFSDSTPTLTYSWYTNEILPGYYLFSMDYTDNIVSNVNYLYSTQVGIKEQTNIISPVIAPNPVKTNTTIYLSEPVNGTIKLYNQTGTCVLNQPVNGQNAIINMESLPAGIYVAVVSNTAQTGKVFTGKVVKE